jgi:cell division protein FtsB
VNFAASLLPKLMIVRQFRRSISMFGSRRKVLRQFLFLSVLLALVVYVASDAIRGAHGLVTNQLLRSRIATLRTELAAVKAQRTRLELDAELLSSKAATQPELLDAQARSLLDLANPTDIVILNEEKTDR